MNQSSQSRDQVIIRSILRMLGAVICLVLCGIMAFGFLASFEESGVTGWKIGYGAFALVFFLGFVGAKNLQSLVSAVYPHSGQEFRRPFARLLGDEDELAHGLIFREGEGLVGRGGVGALGRAVHPIREDESHVDEVLYVAHFESLE